MRRRVPTIVRTIASSVEPMMRPGQWASVSASMRASPRAAVLLPEPAGPSMVTIMAAEGSGSEVEAFD